MLNCSALVQKIEAATHAALAPPDLVTPEARQEAEEILLSFRRSKMPYLMCKGILEMSSVASVQFHAAATLKEAVIREWASIDKETIANLQQFILDFLTERPGITGFLRESLSHVLAVTIKRTGIGEQSVSCRLPLYQHLTSMISSGNPVLEKSACSVLSALCTEFSASDKSSNVGLTWEQHAKCKRYFESHDLEQIFSLVLQVLRHVESSWSDASPTGAVLNLCEKFFAIAEQILSWQFSHGSYSRRFFWNRDATIKVAFKPPKQWGAVLLDSSFLELFFKLHLKVRHHEMLCHGSISCLTQLASLSGDIFEDDEAAFRYLTHYMQVFLHVFSSCECVEHEIMGLSNIIYNLVNMPKPVVFGMLMNKTQLFSAFLQTITGFVCKFELDASTAAENEGDEQVCIDSYEAILNVFTTLVERINEENKQSVLGPCAVRIVQSYLHCHLSPPEGNRKASTDDDNDSDIDDLEEDDRDAFALPLVSIACLSRIISNDTIPLLTRLIEERTSRLKGQIMRMQQHAAHSASENADSLLSDLFEDLHWLILLAGHVLADDCDRETTLMPSEIVKYSIAQKASVSEPVTLRVLGSPNENVSDIPGANESADFVIRLFSAVVRVSEVESQALKSGLINILSPQLSRDILWFFTPWSAAYLVHPEDYYQEISPALSSAFGRNSDGAKWICNFLVLKICSTLTFWTSEIAVLDDAINLLRTLIGSEHRCNLLVENAEFWNLGERFCNNAAPYTSLPQFVRQNIMMAFVRAGSAKMNMYSDKYWQQTLEPLSKRYRNLVSAERVARATQDQSIRSEVLDLLSLLQGVAGASTADTSSLLFNYLALYLADSSKLLDLFHNFNDMVLAILELLTEVSHKQLCYLSQTQCKRMYEWTLAALQSYTKHNLGKYSKDAEEEAYQDLSLIMELLQQVLSKDFIDFDDSTPEAQTEVVITPSANEISPADVVLYGLEIVLPQMNSQLLLYPSLCSQYYKLVTFLCEIYPEKIETLSQPMLSAFVHSLQLGLSSYGIDNCKLCLEALESLAGQCLKTKNQTTELHKAVVSFGKFVFDTLIVHSTQHELLRTAGETFYSLLCLQPQEIMLVFNQVVESQTDPNYKQRLMNSFHKLVPDVNQLIPDRTHRSEFLKNMESNVFDLRGILCIK